MARQPENTADGFSSQIGGMNSGVSPSLIDPSQFAFGLNLTNRGGFPRTRPKYRKIAVDFSGNSDAESWFSSNPISGQYVYQPITNGPGIVVCCAGGRFFAFPINGNSATAFEFTPPGNRNDQFQPVTWFCQAANFLVAQNGEDIPVLFDGANGRRSNILASNEVPVGKQMAYVNNRLFVVLPDGREISPGDLAYSTPTSAVTFTEILLPASEGGQTLSIPLELGAITGLAVTLQYGTATGQGPLLAATNRAIAAINPVVQRNTWPSIQLQSIVLVGNGYTSNGTAIVNGDVWGRSVDGFRSFIQAQRTYNPYFGGWGNTPQSREVQRIIQDDDRSLLQFSDMIYFDNRLLATCMPKNIGNGLGCYHEGIVALNFDNISSIQTKSNPGYDGLWTGIQPYGFCQGSFNGTQRCFAFCYFPDTQTNELWEITAEYGEDEDSSRIPGSIESRSFTFQTPYNAKQLTMAEVFVDHIVGSVDLTLWYKPNQYPCWTEWKSWTVCAAVPDCSDEGPSLSGCVQPQFQALQYRPRMEIGPPPITCDPVLNEILSRGYEFQVKLDWTGQARIRALNVFVNPRPENNNVVGC
jgi:hypothetical protein